jgi:cytochrome c
MRLRLIPTVTAGVMLLSALAAAAQDAKLEQRGRALVGRHCARCHAIDSTGASPHPEAPPFRMLGSRYPIEALAEALAEGLATGHPDMPEFMFEVRDVGAILAYLKSIQDPQNSNPSNHR